MKIWHPYTQESLDGPPLTITHGKGVYLYTQGLRLLDGISSWWVNLHGHGHPVIAEAIAKQARELEHVIFAGFTHERAETLADRLGSILPPALSRLFFSDNGSTAVEVALKIAVQYWHNRGLPEKCRIAALEHAYHGDTVGAMSASADSPFTAPFNAIRFPVFRVRSLPDLEELLSQKSPEIAAMIVEPLIQGAGGMILNSSEFLTGVHELCTKHDVLLIADEVFTGFGRTGSMFACDAAGIVPDLMCLSKGLTGGFMPLAVTLCREEIFQEFYSKDRARTFFHGHSYSGNPLGCAAAIASLEIFQEEPVFDQIAMIEAIHRQRLDALNNRSAISEVRMLGTIAALEVRTERPGYLSNIRTDLYKFFIENGVLLRPLGNVVYIVPPYVISADELHYIYDVIEKAPLLHDVT
jgi:adenosylmethionine-8-amino-7-oxononanoate aminotransferase